MLIKNNLATKVSCTSLHSRQIELYSDKAWKQSVPGRYKKTCLPVIGSQRDNPRLYIDRCSQRVHFRMTFITRLSSGDDSCFREVTILLLNFARSKNTRTCEEDEIGRIFNMRFN